MKINFEDNRNKGISFEELGVGDFFVIVNEDFDPNYCAIWFKVGFNEHANAVDMRDGVLGYVSLVQIVRPLEGELNVKFKYAD